MIIDVASREREPHVPNTADRWYVALDNQRIDFNGRSWVVQVDGIHTQGDDLWIQLSRVGFEGRGVVLHITPGVGIEQALRALAERIHDVPPGDVVLISPPRPS